MEQKMSKSSCWKHIWQIFSPLQLFWLKVHSSPSNLTAYFCWTISASLASSLAWSFLNFFLYTKKKNKGGFWGLLLIKMQVKIEGFSFLCCWAKKVSFFHLHMFSVLAVWSTDDILFFWPYTDGADVSSLSCYLQHFNVIIKPFLKEF